VRSFFYDVVPTGIVRLVLEHAGIVNRGAKEDDGCDGLLKESELSMKGVYHLVG
jgi:hypothetical protein